MRVNYYDSTGATTVNRFTLREAAPTKVREPAIDPHSTPTDTESAWDGPAAVADAPQQGEVLRHMHAIFTGADPNVKGNYKLPHHAPRLESAANIAAVNNALARLSQTQGISTAERDGAEAHLRKHREDAGLEESMAGPEIEAAVKEITVADDLSESQADELLGRLVRLEVARAREASKREAVAAVEDPIALRERAIGEDGTVDLKVIAPGWGSSGYYPREVLMRDGPSVFNVGTKMFWDHPTEAEEDARPEGSLYNLAGELVENARFLDDGAEGPGLYAKAKVFERFAGQVDELAPHIGVSIRASGVGHVGEADGREGKIIDRLTGRDSIDYVTMPGAGGRVLSLFEAARGSSPGALSKLLADTLEGFADDRSDRKETVERMAKAAGCSAGHVYDVIAGRSKPKENELAGLAKALGISKQKVERAAKADGVIESKNDEEVEDMEKLAEAENRAEEAEKKGLRLAERLAMREAADIVRGLIDERKDVPAPTGKRLVESLPNTIELNDDGELEADKFTEAAKKAIDDEVAYLREVTGAKKVRDLGDTEGGDPESPDAEKIDESLKDELVAFGMSEDQAKLALK